MNSRIQIRKPGVCVSPDEAEAAGTTEWLPIEEAAQRIAYDGAEPILESPDHEPKLPPDGCSFSEAFRLWVLEHPLVQEWFGEDRPQISQLRVASYLKAPVWPGTAPESAARQLATLNTSSPSKDNQLLAQPGDRRAHRPMAVKVDELVERLICTIRIHVLGMAVHRMVVHLIAEKLRVTGVWEEDLAKLRQRDIACDWWKRKIVVRIQEQEIGEMTDQSASHREIKRWSNLRVHSGKPIKGSDTGQHVQATKAQLRSEFRQWLEETAEQHRDDWIKNDYFAAAQKKFGKMLTRNLFDEQWRSADLPPECKAPGFRPRNPRKK